MTIELQAQWFDTVVEIYNLLMASGLPGVLTDNAGHYQNLGMLTFKRITRTMSFSKRENWPGNAIENSTNSKS